MAEFTEGPWSVSDTEDYRLLVVAPWSMRVRPESASGYGDYRGLHIASIQHQNDNPCVSKAQAVANARLIAAAPDLLAACETARERMVEAGWHPSTYAVLEEAIVKATGQTDEVQT